MWYIIEPDPEVFHSWIGGLPLSSEERAQLSAATLRRVEVSTQGACRLQVQTTQSPASHIVEAMTQAVQSALDLKEVQWEWLIKEEAATEEATEEEAYLSRLMEEARIRQTQMEAAAKEAATGPKVLMGRAIAKEPIPISEIIEEERSVVVEGEVFKHEVKTMKSGRRLLTFSITDKQDSITAKIFLEEKAEVPAFQEGDWVRVRGRVETDRWTAELTLMPTDISRIEPIRRSDEAEIKRVEFHLHTKMSALDGASDLAGLFKVVKDMGHDAVAITDHGVVQAFPKAAELAGKAKVKLLLGLEGYLVNAPVENGEVSEKSPTYHIILLAKNRTGLINLYRLVSYSHMQYFYRHPRIPREVLQAHREGLIIGSACEAGELYQALLEGKSREELRRIASFYDYLEIQPIGNNLFLAREGRVSEARLRELNQMIIALGDELKIPVIATGDVHFVNPEDEVHRRILMAGQGFSDADQQAPLYYRNTQEMLDEFSYLPPKVAYQVVVENPRALADSIEPLRPIPSDFCPPVLEGAESQVEEMTYAKARELYGDPLPELVQKRVEKELKAIIGNGFAVLYLIAQKLVRKSLDDGYLVGSRGSVGSSVVATFCEITEVNPLPPHYRCPQCKYSEFIEDGSYHAGPDLPPKDCPGCQSPMERDGFAIPFESFMGFKGDKVPDIDLNFSGEHQPVIHKYTEELFGKDYVFKAGTIGTLADKTAFGFVKGYLADRGLTKRQAELDRLVAGCVGVKRTTGQHPGGMIVVPQGREIYEFSPIQHPANDPNSGIVTTHFEYTYLHDQLVKLDILGHDDPTVLRLLGDLTGLDVQKIPLDDPETMSIFNSLGALGIGPKEASGEVGTLGIPEMNTRFVRGMLQEYQPQTFGDLIRVSGFSHGTGVWIGNAQELIASGTAPASEVIATREDMMNFLTRHNLEPAVAFKIVELVRKGRGLPDADAELMKEHKIPDWYIDSCRKVTYLFPKAHASAYVIMAFRIAYFKVHHPEAFYATYFSVRADGFDAHLVSQGLEAIEQTMAEIERKGNEATAKDNSVYAILEVVREAMARGIRFRRVHLYESDPVRFRITPEGLLPPLAALQGLGQNAAQALAQARSQGEFSSIEDLRQRSRLSKTVIEVLREHGSLTGMDETDQMTLF